MYSAYDAQHVFKVPLRVERAIGRLTLTSMPGEFVDTVPASFGLMLTTRQVGNTQIVVRDEAGNTGSTSLTITRAEASDYERGKSQYHAQADAGVNPPACSSCHVTGQAGGVDPARVDVEHTPQQLAGYSDEELIAIFSEGKKPLGARFRVVNGAGAIPDSTAARIFAGFHAWSLDEATRKGLVIYLRGLEPKTQGSLDFGGLYTAPR